MEVAFACVANCTRRDITPQDSEETAVEEVGAREVARAGATGASAGTGALSRRTGRKR